LEVEWRAAMEGKTSTSNVAVSSARFPALDPARKVRLSPITALAFRFDTILGHSGPCIALRAPPYFVDLA
jgi:hypothetical protein